MALTVSSMPSHLQTLEAPQGERQQLSQPSVFVRWTVAVCDALGFDTSRWKMGVEKRNYLLGLALDVPRETKLGRSLDRVLGQIRSLRDFGTLSPGREPEAMENYYKLINARVGIFGLKGLDKDDEGLLTDVLTLESNLFIEGVVTSEIKQRLGGFVEKIDQDICRKFAGSLRSAAQLMFSAIKSYDERECCLEELVEQFLPANINADIDPKVLDQLLAEGSQALLKHNLGLLLGDTAKLDFHWSRAAATAKLQKDAQSELRSTLPIEEFLQFGPPVDDDIEEL